MKRRHQDLEPTNFDPAAHPIIASHFFDVEPFRPIGEVTVGVVAKLALKRKVERGAFVAERGRP